MNRRKKLWRVCSVLFCFTQVLLGCDHRPKLVIEGGTAPWFKVEGRGSIQVIDIYGPDLENAKTAAGSPSMKTYWEIAPTEDWDVERLAKSGGVVYGQVPQGFKQVIPENGAPPRPLSENEHFTFRLRVANASGVGAGFTIHDGKARVDGS